MRPIWKVEKFLGCNYSGDGTIKAFGVLMKIEMRCYLIVKSL